MVAGQTLSNHVQVAVSAAGEVCLVASMATHLVVDLVGAFTIDPSGWWYHATTPTRLVDSREGVGVPVGPITRGGFGAQSVPANSDPALTAVPDEARALVLTAVAVDPMADGWLTVAPCVDTGAYGTVALNTTAGRTTANLTVVPTRTATGREVCMFSMMVAHQVLDLAGWYARASLTRLPSAARSAGDQLGEGRARSRASVAGRRRERRRCRARCWPGGAPVGAAADRQW